MTESVLARLRARINRGDSWLTYDLGRLLDPVALERLRQAEPARAGERAADLAARGCLLERCLTTPQSGKTTWKHVIDGVRSAVCTATAASIL